MHSMIKHTLALLALFTAFSIPIKLFAQEDASSVKKQLAGGLVLQIGADDLATVITKAKTGRFVIRILESDKKKIKAAQEQLQQLGLYGLVSVDELDQKGKLPFAENLVNLIVVQNATLKVSNEEMNRVLTPGGFIFNAKGEGTQKPYPNDMDIWSHPRHAADGKAMPFLKTHRLDLHDAYVGWLVHRQKYVEW